MRVVFYASIFNRFDSTMAKSFKDGCVRLGDRCLIEPISEFKEPWDKCSLAVVFGVKDRTREVLEAYRAVNVPVIYIDKGYARLPGGALRTLYWRASINAYQPLDYFRQVPMPNDRWKSLDIMVATRKHFGNRIMFAGSSQKFCDLHSLGDANEYANRVITEIKKYTDREVVYRPKPSWKGATPLDGSTFSSGKDKFQAELKRCRSIVTYGSNACFESLLHGVPPIVLGNGITRSISSTDVSEINDPRIPGYDEVYQLACDVAYCQWSLEEFSQGKAWKHLRSVLERINGSPK